MNFDFEEFVKYIARKRKLDGVRYYIGQIKPKEGDEKSQELHKQQQVLFEKIKKAGFYIVRGHLRQIGKVFTEKGVDVRIGIDLIEGCYEDRYDTAILISSDGDLAPAVEMVVRKNKKIEVIGFAHKPLYSLMQKATKYYAIKKAELKKFVKKGNKTEKTSTLQAPQGSNPSPYRRRTVS